ncbi:hypothetical protein [Roseovarius arcticus]|uniref:hypothetical protein n=1 Tax=Roseovarius arcticus TaxID=2547404 RepID=UPI0011109C30|nr:hypothetical protein [Roseovarius arcticus]
MIDALGLAIISLSILGNWQKAGLVAATALVGFGVQLAFRDPFWFQQVRIRPQSGFQYLMLACLVLQGATAAMVLWQNSVFRRIPGVLVGLGIWRVLLVAAVLVLASRSVMEPISRHDPALYLKQLIIALTFLGINIASFVALVIALPGPQLHKLADVVTTRISLPGSGDRQQKFDRWFPCLAAGIVFVICLLIATLSFGGVPHLDDIIYLFQAKSYASGLMTLPLPPSLEAFDHYLMNSYQGRWFSITFPGWPLALAIGELVHMPWIVNPALAAGSILLLHRFAASMTDRGTANLVALLMAVSPWYVSVSSTMLMHTFTWALILGAWVLLIRTRERPSILLPLIAGALMGWLFLARPLEGVLIGTLTGVWTLAFLQDRRHWKTVALYSIGAIAVGALIFPYQAYLTGDPLLTPLNAYYDVYWGPHSNALGFGPEMGAVPDWGDIDVFAGHSPAEALINAHQNLYEVNSSLFGWGGASLIFVLIFVMWGPCTRFAAAMMTIIVATVALYSLYWFYGGYYAGARYWFMTLIPFLVLTALGITACIREFHRIFPDAMVAKRVGIGIGFLCLSSLLVFESWLAFNRYPEINGYHTEYSQLAQQDEFQNALVFVSTDSPQEYGSAFWLNDFSPRSQSPLFARDLGAESNRRAASAYPGRKILFVNGRSSDHRHVTVTKGPLTLNDLE